MEIVTRQLGSALVAAVSGRVDSLTAVEFQQGLSNAIEAGGGKLVLDCGELSYISSAGLRALLVCIKQADAAEGRLNLCCVPDRIREVLDVSGFVRFTQLFNTIAEAEAGISAG